MFKSFKVPLTVLLVGVILMILTYPFRASEESRLNSEPKATAQAEIVKYEIETDRGSTGLTTYHTSYRFVAGRRIYEGDCLIALPGPPEGAMLVDYLLQDPSVNCLSRGHLVSWGWFLAGCAVAGVGGVWFLVVFLTGSRPGASTAKEGTSKNRASKKRKQRRR